MSLPPHQMCLYMSECQEPGNASEALETNRGSGSDWMIVRTQSENKSNQGSSVKPGVGRNLPKLLRKTLNLVCGLLQQVFTLFKCLARVFVGFVVAPSSCCYTNGLQQFIHLLWGLEPFCLSQKRSRTPKTNERSFDPQRPAHRRGPCSHSAMSVMAWLVLMIQ